MTTGFALRPPLILSELVARDLNLAEESLGWSVNEILEELIVIFCTPLDITSNTVAFVYDWRSDKLILVGNLQTLAQFH